MNYRVAMLQSSAFGESGFRGCKMVERGRPKAGQNDHFLHVLVSLEVVSGELKESETQNGRVFVFWGLFPTSCRRAGRLKWDLNTKWDSYCKLHSLSF